MTLQQWQLVRRQPEPGWRDLAPRFGEDLTCLAAFLALEAAEVLAGEKPANLVNVGNRPQPCGRNLYHLWKEHGGYFNGATGLGFRLLADRGQALLLLVYREESLKDLLAQRKVRNMLQRLGYPTGAGLGEVLNRLEERLEEGDFPHEVGIFLGYPLKDVAGFLGWGSSPFTCQGPWRIYGDPAPSLRLAARHRRCRRRMAHALAAAADPFRQLTGTG